MRKIDFKMLNLSTFILGIMLSFPLFSQTEPMGDMFELAKMKSGVKNRRISSTDPTVALASGQCYDAATGTHQRAASTEAFYQPYGYTPLERCLAESKGE